MTIHRLFKFGWLVEYHPQGATVVIVRTYYGRQVDKRAVIWTEARDHYRGLLARGYGDPAKF
jgi:hypothetical protein